MNHSLASGVSYIDRLSDIYLLVYAIAGRDEPQGVMMRILERLFGRGSTERCSARDIAALVESGAILIDVRTRAEHVGGHIPGSRCLPLTELTKHCAALPKDRKVVVSCLSGHRSRMAIGRMQAMGFKDLVNLDGGFAAWKHAGLPVERHKG